MPSDCSFTVSSVNPSSECSTWIREKAAVQQWLPVLEFSGRAQVLKEREGKEKNQLYREAMGERNTLRHVHYKKTSTKRRVFRWSSVYCRQHEKLCCMLGPARGKQSWCHTSCDWPETLVHERIEGRMRDFRCSLLSDVFNIKRIP